MKHTKLVIVLCILVIELLAGITVLQAQEYRVTANNVRAKIDVDHTDNGLNVSAMITNRTGEEIFILREYTVALLGEIYVYPTVQRLKMKKLNHGDTMNYGKVFKHLDTDSTVTLVFTWLNPNKLPKSEKKQFRNKLEQLDSVTYQGIYPLDLFEFTSVRYPIRPR